MKQRYLQVGQIVKPHGIRGELGVKSLTERPDLRFQPGNELLAGPDEGTLGRVKILSARPHKLGFLAVFESVEDREAAEAMRGWGLFIREEEAAELDPDRYYHHQLVGLNVLDEDRAVLGRVGGIVEMPANDLLEVESVDGGKFLVPMVDEIVRRVDIEAGTLTVRLPEGLREL
jgi:16S rRNA processing protein RimM